MPKPEKESLSHSFKAVENFSIAPSLFYEKVEANLRKRTIPDQYKTDRVFLKEGGLLSASREYLRIIKGRDVVHICAAPWGSVFFFSLWATRLPPPIYLFLILLLLPAALNVGVLFLGGILVTLTKSCFGTVLLVFLAVLALPAFLALLGYLLREGVIRGEAEVIDTPVIGPLYIKIFNPQTFYRHDTSSIFGRVLSTAFKEALDEVLEGMGQANILPEILTPIDRELQGLPRGAA